MTLKEQCLQKAKLLLENMPAIRAYINGETIEINHHKDSWNESDTPDFDRFLYRPKPKCPIGHALAVKLMLDETPIKHGTESVGTIECVFRSGVRFVSPTTLHHTDSKYVSFVELMEYETPDGTFLCE